MAYRVLMYAYRKPGITPQTFEAHYEDVHVPLVKKMTGALFPLAHKRTYIPRQVSSATPESEVSFPVEVIGGLPSVFYYDAIMEMNFESQDVFHEFSNLLAQPENEARIAENCALFLDVCHESAVYGGHRRRVPDVSGIG